MENNFNLFLSVFDSLLRMKKKILKKSNSMFEADNFTSEERTCYKNNIICSISTKITNKKLKLYFELINVSINSKPFKIFV